MFLAGRQKTAWLRGTAGLGVALMLSGLFRPAFAAMPEAKAADAKAAAAASPMAPMAPPPTTATAASGERVRGAIVPVAVKLDKGAMGVDPWTLFDGDGSVAFTARQPLRVRVSLPRDVALETIGVFGGKGAAIAVSADGPAGPKPIAGLEKIALEDLPARWNRFSATASVETPALLLDITPAPGQVAEVPELELWGKTAPIERPMSSRAWAEALLTHLPVGAVQAVASPSEATIASPRLGPAGHVPFTFDLDRANRQFDRAFLVYELDGMSHWSAVVRRVNWQAPQGGFHAVHAARHGLQVEEISPDWLREGRNELQFLVSNVNDLAGYKVKNVRVVGVPAAGSPDALVQIADKAAIALFDGNRETGLTNKDLRRARTAVFRFAETSQPDSLLVAVDKGAKGTLSAQAIVNGKVDSGSQVAAELDQLAAGWARLSLDNLPAEAEGIRVTLRGAGGESTGGLVSELRVTGSRLPTRRVSRMTVTYPLHGECVDGEAYIRGFLRGDVKGAALRIAGTKRTEALKWDGSFSAVVPPPGRALRSGGKWQVQLEAGFANGEATGTMVDVEGCKEPVAAKSGPVEDEGAPFGQVVRAGESARLSFAGATLEIPAGALEDDTRITIRPITDIDIPATDESLTNVTAGGRAYRLGPHGLKFGSSIKLTIPFDRSRFVGGQAEDDMGAYFFDEEAKRWRQVQTLKGDASAQLLTAATDHFTDFIAGTVSMPDHPTADSFNPNAIKDLKAADPGAGINLITPPAASPDGAAHLSFPLWVPPGRQGMQPSLAVTYNSSAGNGLMGMGWSLPISSIGVDTRFGVGRYSRTEETERYEIDGEMLVADPGQSPRAVKTSYHRKAEGKFDAIYRIEVNQAGPIEEPDTQQGDVAYHWEVLDKHGTRYIYGETYSARGSRELRGVFRWYLSRVIDAFGNQILYTYDKTAPQLFVQSAVDLPTVQVLLKSIQYTADANGQNAHYRVDFLYDAQTSSTDVRLKDARPDVYTDARGGTVEVMDKRLARVLVYENPDTGNKDLRRYDFPYILGSWDKSLLYAIVVAKGAGVSDPDAKQIQVGEFYRHTFNYYKVVRNQTNNRIGFDAPVAWPGGPGGKGFSDAEGDSVNGSAAVGGGVALCEATGHAVVGYSSSFSVPLPLPPIISDHNKNTDEALRGLIDVNGDGLPDFVDGNGVLLNRGDSTFTSNPRSFGTQNANFKTPGKVHIADRSSNGLNANVHFLFEAGHVGFGKVWGSSGDNVMVADIDGDGFVDYLTNNTGNNMELNSHGQGFSTPAGWDVPQADFQPADVQADQKNSFQLTEPTAMWTAPFGGFVNISSVAQKAPNTSPKSDGVQLIVEQYQPTSPAHSNLMLRRTTTITDSAIQNGPGATHQQVAKGDRFYFRVNAIDDIDDDAVIWVPVITYTDAINEPNFQAFPVDPEQGQLPEPYSGAAFTFVQASGSDMRVAGEPIPSWHNDSAGSATVVMSSKNRFDHTNTTTGVVTPAGSVSGWKDATSDKVKLEVFLAPRGNMSNLQSITPSGFQTDYDADFVGPISSFSPPPQSVANVGDQIIFQVSAQSPIDAKQIDWKPHVDFQSYCRNNSLPANSNDFTNQTTFCGQVINCASATGCELSGDPNPSANHIATTTVSQDIPAYFQLNPWVQFGLPVGFIPPADGTISFNSGLQGLFPGRVMVRGLNKLYFAQDSGGGSIPAGGIQVKGGDGILFDVFVKDVPRNLLPGPGGPVNDPTTWTVTMHFSGGGVTRDRTIVARRNYLIKDTLNPPDPGSGHIHGWQYFERYVDPANPTFFDPAIAQFLAQGGSTPVSRNPGTISPLVGLMRPAPDGIPLPPPGVSVPGPLWVGSSVDGYIGEGLFKPSRTSRPVTGSRITFSSTSSVSTDSGAGGLFKASLNFSTSSTNLQFIDINGDHYPDLVMPDGVRINRPVFPDPNDATATGGGHFDPKAPIRGSTINLNNPNSSNTPLGDLESTDGREVSESLGVSSPIRAGMRLSGKKASDVPGWLSALPSIGVAYGNSQTLARLIDINGDGLPDHVSRDDAGKLHVRLNLGFRPDDPDHAYQFTGDIETAVVTWNDNTVTNPNIDKLNSFLAVVPDSDLETMLTGALQSGTKNTLNNRHGLRADALRVSNSAGNNIGAGYSYFGGGLNFGISRTTTDMIDINGDGLPDLVKRDPGSGTMSVLYNLGNVFIGEELWDVPSWPTPQQGVVEQVETAGFGSSDALAFTQTHGLSESVGYPYYYETVLYGCWGGEVGVGAGQNFTGSEMRFEDIDGDGAPDQVLKVGCNDLFASSNCNNETNLYVRRNPARGTVVNGVGGAPPNLLANVFGPLGGQIDLSYIRIGNVVDAGNHVDMPNRQNVLVQTEVVSITASGSPIQDTAMQTLFDYGVTPSTDPQRPTSEPSGFYDRANREFLGFGHITTTRMGDGLQVQRFYDNTSYAGRHNLLSQETRDTNMTGGPKLFTRTVNTYGNPRQVFSGSNDSLFVPLLSEQTFLYEGQTNDPNAPIRSTTSKRDYDATGNLILMSDLGDDDPAVSTDDIHFAITYQFITDPATGATFPRPRNVFACSVPVTPTAAQPCPTANTLRHRTGTYGPHGEMLTLIDDHFDGKDPATGNTYAINQTDPLVYAFTYDGFGNLQNSTDPTGYNLIYTYDSTTNSHIRTIRDQFGYQSTRDYDLRFGSLRDTTDVNGYRMHFDADIFGRLVTVFAPQDIGSLQPTDDGSLLPGATISFSYAIPTQTKIFGQPQPIFWALTKHKDVFHPTGNPANPTDTIDTVVLVDGMGRIRQTKKDAVNNGQTTTRILSGRTTFDQVGRVRQEGFPAFDTGGTQTGFSSFPNTAFARTYSYDVMGRVRAIQTPDDKGPDIAPDGAKVVTTKMSFDPKTLDGRTQLAATITDPQGKIRTQYQSPRGEILAVSEQNRLGTSNTLTTLTTRYTHDRLSQLTQVEDPTRNAANLTTATYDSLGNMVFLKSPDSGQTEWRYDLSGRLAAKETANLRFKKLLVNYTYEFNRIKTIAYPSATAFPGATGLVTYTYGTKDEAGAAKGNIAGRLAMVTDESGKETRQYDSLGNISHTERTPAKLSPSIPDVTYKMDYAYDPLGRMQTMTFPDGEAVTYGYDAGGLVNNVKGTRLNGTVTNYVTGINYNEFEQRKAITFANGSSSNYFYYPDTKRLQILQSTGGTAQLHNSTYVYDLVGNITSITNNLPTLPPVAPNTVIAPGPTSQSYTYDDLYQLKSASGSYTGCACGCGNSRTFGLSYEYDGLGNITRKNQTDTIFKPSIGAVPQAATTYNNVYTYGAQQSFGPAGPHAPTAVGPETVSYDRDGNQTQYSGTFGPSRALTWTEDDRLRSETDSGFTTSFLYDAAGERTHKRRTTLETWYVNANYVVKNSLTESKHIMVGNDRVVTAVATMTNRADPKTAGTNTLFYYHPDHIQSTSYVTGGDGSILQHDEYFPGGEVWFQEQKNNDARNTQPYLFNGKELDETGLYYFGARYYNPKLSVWVNPDPLLPGYMTGGVGGASPANLGLYTYAWNNPIILRDLDGRGVDYIPPWEQKEWHVGLTHVAMTVNFSDQENAEDWAAASGASKPSTSSGHKKAERDTGRELNEGKITSQAAAARAKELGVQPVSHIGPSQASADLAEMELMIAGHVVMFLSGEIAAEMVGELFTGARAAKTANEIGKEGEEAVSRFIGIERNVGEGRAVVKGTGKGGFRVPDFDPAATIAKRGTVVEVKNIKGGLSMTRQIRDLLNYARSQKVPLEIFTNAAQPTRGALLKAIKAGEVILRAIPL